MMFLLCGWLLLGLDAVVDLLLHRGDRTGRARRGRGLPLHRVEEVEVLPRVAAAVRRTDGLRERLDLFGVQLSVLADELRQIGELDRAGHAGRRVFEGLLRALDRTSVV